MRRTLTCAVAGLLAVSSLAATLPDTEAPDLRSFIPNWQWEERDVYVSAYPDDRRTGGSAIADVTITVDGVEYHPPAEDGAYDEPFETVESFLGTSGLSGVLEVCGWATDVAGNSSAPRCEAVDTRDLEPPYATARPVALPAQPHVTDQVSLHTTWEDHRSTVAGISYVGEDGVVVPMSAQDGAFDEPRESASAELGQLPAGTHRFCTAAVDSLDNASSTFFVPQPVAHSTPSDCVDVTVADRVGPTIGSVTPSQTDPAFSHELRLEVEVSDRDPRESGIRHVDALVDGVSVSRNPVDGAPTDATVAVHVGTLPDDDDSHLVCVVATDMAGNTSSQSCIAVRVGPQQVTAELVLEPAQPGLGADGHLVADVAADASGNITLRRIEASDGVGTFVADAITSFDAYGLSGLVHITGTGLLAGAAPCDFELSLTDGDASLDPSATDDVFMRVSCGGVTDLFRPGDIVSGEITVNA